MLYSRQIVSARYMFLLISYCFFRFKDAREVYPSRKYEMFFWDNKATLAIKDTEPNDTGRYRCEVSNRLGRIESTGSLHVYSASCC